MAIIDLTKLSKSYPYLSLAHELGLSYSDVLMVSELFQPGGSMHVDQMARVLEVVNRTRPEHKRAIAQVAAAIANEEIGHGG